MTDKKDLEERINERLRKLDAYIDREDRLINLEKQFDKLSGKYWEHEERLKEIEQKLMEFDNDLDDIEERIEDVEEKDSGRISSLKNALSHFQVENSKLRNELSKTPHKCPNCYGFGSLDIVSNACARGPREHYIATNPCHSCDGKGVLWK